MNVLLCLSHSIEEHDQVLLMHELGLGVASLGGYLDPAHPDDPKRPPLPHVPAVPTVQAAVDAVGGTRAAQSRIPDAVLDWLGDDGVIVYHHYLERLMDQWGTLRHWLHGASERRVIWRTVGQSNPDLEAAMGMFRRDGLEIVRYSPFERHLPNYAGEDALIRFWKDPDEWSGWIGDEPFVTTVCQDMLSRDPWTNYGFWRDATAGLPAVPLGVGSEAVGGPGTLPLDSMVERLRHARAYLYTGTQPASYTLAFIEALMLGIPLVAIARSFMRNEPWIAPLYEAGDLALLTASTPDAAAVMLRRLLADPDADLSALQRARAIELFGKDTIAAAWAAYLRVPALVPA